MSAEQPRPAQAHRFNSVQGEHLPLRPLWMCRICGQPWPCGPAKLTLLAEYQDSRISLFLYLAGCLHDAIDDLHRLNPTRSGSAADMFDRFLSWPTRHTGYHRGTTSRVQTEEARVGRRHAGQDPTRGVANPP